MGRCGYSVSRAETSIETIASMGIARTATLDLAAITEMDEAHDAGEFAPWWEIASRGGHLEATLPPSSFPIPSNASHSQAITRPQAMFLETQGRLCRFARQQAVSQS